MPVNVNFARKALYEESRTDWYVTQFDIRIQCMLNMSYLNVNTTPGGVGIIRPVNLTKPANIVNLLWTMLMTPRKKLSYNVDGVEMIPQSQANLTGGVDAMNGPQPQHCNIMQLTPTSFILDYHIIAHYWVNNKGDGSTGNLKGNNVLYNRWSEQIMMDETMHTTRIRQGTMRIRSDNTSQITPDDLRSDMVVLSIPYKFVRAQSQYAISPDGLTLGYKIVDREVFKLPPTPAFKAEGYFLELGTKPGAVYREGIVNVRLYGAPNIPQSQLYVAAWTIAAQKMSANLGAPQKGVYDNPQADGTTKEVAFPQLKIPLLSSVQRKIWLYENIVEVEARALLNFSTARIAGAPIGQGPLTETPGSDDVAKIPPPYTDRGAAGLFLRAAAYWDPSVTSRTQLYAQQNATGPNPLTTITRFGEAAPREALIPFGVGIPGTQGNTA